MTNTTLPESAPTETIADLHELWKELTGRFGNDPAGMTAHHKAVGGKLFALCMKNIPTASTVKEIKEITESLVSLGCSNAPKGQGLLASALMKWRMVCTTPEEAAEADAMLKALIPI